MACSWLSAQLWSCRRPDVTQTQTVWNSRVTVKVSEQIMCCCCFSSITTRRFYRNPDLYSRDSTWFWSVVLIRSSFCVSVMEEGFTETSSKKHHVVMKLCQCYSDASIKLYSHRNSQTVQSASLRNSCRDFRSTTARKKIQRSKQVKQIMTNVKKIMINNSKSSLVSQQQIFILDIIFWSDSLSWRRS